MLQLTLTEIEKITLGAVNVTQDSQGVTLHRFSETEEKLYIELDEKRNRNDSVRVMSPAGIKLAFRTNSKTLRMTADFYFSSRNFYAFDIFENGKLLTSLKSFNESELPFMYSEYSGFCEKPGHFDREIALSNGEKDILIHLPWSVKMHNFTINLDDGATLIPTEKPAKKIICYGDSISQGFDALYPHRRYTAQLAAALDAEEINKAIGGEFFNPALAECTADFTPDYITAAYGVNDWLNDKYECFEENAREFYRALSKNYPDSKIFAITPIWTSVCNEERKVGSFSFLDEHITAVTADLPNVTVIHGDALVPHYIDLFADLYLHPSDAGFDFYAMNLIREIRKHI